jgi:hypothetical protein
MSTELLLTGESLEMPITPLGTLGVREFGEVAVPIAKANSVLATVLLISIGMIL